MTPLAHESLESLAERSRTELVLGLVAAVGTDLSRVETFINEKLQDLGYQSKIIHVTELLKTIDTSRFGIKLKDTPEYQRIWSRIKGGNRLRELSSRKDIFALYAAQQILATRPAENGPTDPQYRKAHIIHSLKHPDEVRTLRNIYGQGFFLIGVYCPEAFRLRNLIDRKLIPEQQARKLIRTDEDEKEGYGQHARDTFELSDVFIPMAGNEDEAREHLSRFLDLVFGAPSMTPTREEHGMFMAFAAALRSGSLARQVGAVITSPTGDVIASGANDAPQYGGGQYWPGFHDQRDSARGLDYNDIIKRRLVVDIMRKVKGQYEGTPPRASDDELYAEGRKIFADTGLLDITEYSRDVHAEMAALTACARTGAKALGAHLYATTFPCHNCAKHIVAAGINQVYFVEPYPKSHALKLHDDSIVVADGLEAKGKVAFKPFVGVGPRRFFDLFSMKLSSGRAISRKDKAGRSVEWTAAGATPRIPLLPYSYLQKERIAADELRESLDNIDKSSTKGNKPWPQSNAKTQAKTQDSGPALSKTKRSSRHGRNG